MLLADNLVDSGDGSGVGTTGYGLLVKVSETLISLTRCVYRKSPSLPKAYISLYFLINPKVEAPDPAPMGTKYSISMTSASNSTAGLKAIEVLGVRIL